MQNIFVFSPLLPGEKCCCGPGTASSIHGCLLDYWECSLECPRFFWQANPPPSNPRIPLHSSVSPGAARGDRAAGDAALMKEWLCEVQGWCLHSRAGRTLLLETAFHPSSISHLNCGFLAMRFSSQSWSSRGNCSTSFTDNKEIPPPPRQPEQTEILL